MNNIPTILYSSVVKRSTDIFPNVVYTMTGSVLRDIYYIIMHHATELLFIFLQSTGFIIECFLGFRM